MKHVIYLIVALLMGLYMQAEAGVGGAVVRGGQELVEQGVRVLLKKAVKEGAEELSESAAKKAVRELMQHSDDVARLAQKFGEDALVRVIRTPQVRQLCTEGGEDAVLAILRHGDQAVELLSKTPKESLRGVAAVLGGMEKPAARRMTAAIRGMGDEAEGALDWVCKHPKLATMGFLGTSVGAFVGTLLLTHPEARGILDHILEYRVLYTTAFFILVGIVSVFALLRLWKKYVLRPLMQLRNAVRYLIGKIRRLFISNAE